MSLALVAAALAATAPRAAARLEVSTFARVPAPGYPADALVAGDDSVYAGTFRSLTSPSDTGPSKVFAFGPGGTIARTFTIAGQTPGAAHGVQTATTDRAGRLYLLDQAPARVVRLDPRTGEQTTWATFAKLPACGDGAPAGACSPAALGGAPEPDFASWGPDGALYVTDYAQAVIWRVPPQGGAAKVWLGDARFDGAIVGVAGIRLMADGRTFMVSSGGGGTDPATGKLYTVAVRSDGAPGPLRQVWESAPGEAPDGLALSQTGSAWVALVGPAANAVVEISPDGRELARVPTSPVANARQPIPFDAPGSATFRGTDLLVANQSAIVNDPSHWALLSIATGERGLPLARPPEQPLHYRLRTSPAQARRGRRTQITFTASAIGYDPASPSAPPTDGLAGARLRFAGRGYTLPASGARRVTLTLRATGRRRATLLVGGRRVAHRTVTVGR